MNNNAFDHVTMKSPKFVSIVLVSLKISESTMFLVKLLNGFWIIHPMTAAMKMKEAIRAELMRRLSRDLLLVRNAKARMS